jgi:hypothetical protein
LTSFSLQIWPSVCPLDHDRAISASIAVICRLTGEAKPSLSDLRNESAHGAPFDGFPQSGLLELVRDLIDYAYRDWPSNAEMAAMGQFDPQPGEELPDTAEC